MIGANRGMRVQRWPGPGWPEEAELGELMRREGLAPYAWSNRPGDTYAAHSHTYDKVIYVVRGSVTWVLPETGQHVETQAGDRIDLARGVIHAALVGAQGVLCLEGHRD